MQVLSYERSSSKTGRRYRFFALCLILVLSCIIAPQFTTQASASNETAAPRAVTFLDAYHGYFITRTGRANEILREAADSEKRKDLIHAAAGYLVGSVDAIERAQFDEAKITLDRAFFLAGKLPSEAREQFAKSSEDLFHTQLRNRRPLEANFEIYYLCSLLDVVKSIAGYSPRQKASLARDLAYAYLRNKNYKQATDTLEKQLTELEPSDNESRYSCLYALARIYDEQRDVKRGQHTYLELLASAKATRSDRSADALEQYLKFLLKNELYGDAVPIADQYINSAWTPREVRYLNRRPWVLLARDFAKGKKYSVAERYYKAAFYIQTHEHNPPINSSYGQTAREWAEMLAEQKKFPEAAEVLRDAIRYARTLRPDVADRNLSTLTTQCVQYLNAAGQKKEAEKTAAEGSEDAKRLVETRSAEAAHAIANPSKNTLAAIKALTERAYKELDAKDTDAGVKDLMSAISLYEGAPQGYDAEHKYYCFQKIRSRFKNIGREQEGIDLLWRIVKARMQVGYSDPDNGFRSQCGGPTLTADYELLHTSAWTKNEADKKMAEQFLSLAKTSGKSENIIFALCNMREPMGKDREKEISIEEQLEKERENGKNRFLYVVSVSNTARAYIRAQQFESAYTKYKQLLEVSKGQPAGLVSLAGLLSSLASEFEFFKDFKHAKEVSLKAFESSFTVPHQHFRDGIAKKVVELANKEANEGRLSESSTILENAKKIALAQGNAGAKFIEQFDQASRDLKSKK